MDVVDTIVEIAERRPIIEAAYDPWRFRSEAIRLEREHRLQMVEFPQSHARMTAASESLHAAIVSRRLVHPADPALDRHVNAAIAKATGRGWRLMQSERTAQIDAAIALAMAVERAEAQQARQPTRLLGWI
jgi:phage terminase large subunit-like protein